MCSVGLLHSMFKAGRLLWPRHDVPRVQHLFRLLCGFTFLGSVIGFGWLGTLPILQNSLTSPSSYTTPSIYFYGIGFIVLFCMLLAAFIAAASKWLMIAEMALLGTVIGYASILSGQTPDATWTLHLHHYQLMFASLLLTRRQPKQVWLHNSLVILRWVNMGVMVQGTLIFGCPTFVR